MGGEKRFESINTEVKRKPETLRNLVLSQVVSRYIEREAKDKMGNGGESSSGEERGDC